MIFTYSDYVQCIQRELSARPRKVWIASFGLNVGVSDIGNVYSRSPSFQLFSAINKDTSGSRVLIGCPIKPDRKFLRRVTNSAEYFPSLQWKTHPESHLKCWLFFHGPDKITSLFGGRNVGDSDWADATVYVKNGEARALAHFYDQLWMRGREVSKTRKLVLKG